jgi:nucleotide-binding universal stress UspA family protein
MHPDSPGSIMRHVLIADDGSEEAWRAVEVGTDLALRYHAKATLLTVIHHPAYPATVGEVQEADLEQREFAARVQRRATAYAEPLGLRLDPVVTSGHPVEAIVEYARKHAVDLIVMGYRGMSNLQRFFGGSVSDRVVDHAPCNVLIVRRLR